MLDVLACYGTRPAAGGRLLRKPDPIFLRYWSFRSEDHWSELRAVACPVLVVRAAESAVLTPEVAERMAAEARHGRLVQIPDSGHLVCVEQPVALASTVLEFLSA
jgi:pimeloyl-ACP methyl ester carboxylesterase